MTIIQPSILRCDTPAENPTRQLAAQLRKQATAAGGVNSELRCSYLKKLLHG